MQKKTGVNAIFTFPPSHIELKNIFHTIGKLLFDEKFYKQNYTFYSYIAFYFIASKPTKKTSVQSYDIISLSHSVRFIFLNFYQSRLLHNFVIKKNQSLSLMHFPHTHTRIHIYVSKIENFHIYIAQHSTAQCILLSRKYLLRRNIYSPIFKSFFFIRGYE